MANCELRARATASKKIDGGMTQSEDLRLMTRDATSAHITHDVLRNLSVLLLLYLVLAALATNLRGQPEVRSLIGWITTFAAYLYLGASVFPYLEVHAELDSRRATAQLLASVRGNLTDEAFEQVARAVGGPRWDSAELSDLRWSFNGAAFFSFTLMTTIGYGSFTPQTAAGKAFTLVYAPVGIAIAAVTYVSLAERVLSLVESGAFHLMRVDRLKVAFDDFDADGSGQLSHEEVAAMLQQLGASVSLSEFEQLMGGALGGQGRVTYEGFAAALASRPALRKKVLTRSLEVYRWSFAFGLLGALLALSTGLHMAAEGWGGLDSLYFTVLTLTTIGLGDLTPSVRHFATWGLWFYLVGLGVTALVVSAAVDIAPKLGHAARAALCGAAGAGAGEPPARVHEPAGAPSEGAEEAREADEAAARAQRSRAESEKRTAWESAGRGGGMTPMPPTSFAGGGRSRPLRELL